MNSASVAGGEAPAPLHSTWPDPQSPVEHEPEPDPSNLQPVRPQKRPDQPVGAWKEREPSWGSSKPVLSRGAVPAFARIPGHTVYSHLFTNVNVAPFVPVESRRSARKSLNRSMSFSFLFCISCNLMGEREWEREREGGRCFKCVFGVRSV